MRDAQAALGALRWTDVLGTGRSWVSSVTTSCPSLHSLLIYIKHSAGKAMTNETDSPQMHRGSLDLSP